MDAAGEAMSRAAGQHARATVIRLRIRAIVTLGVLAVATAALGRTLGLHDLRFLASELALLATIFVISRYVLPLVERRDRGASAEEQVGSLLEQLPADSWRVIHDASFGRGNIDHILIGPAGVFSIETKSHPGPVRVGRVHGATHPPGASPARRHRTGRRHERRAAARVQPCLGRPAARAPQGRTRAPRTRTHRASAQAPHDALAR